MNTSCTTCNKLFKDATALRNHRVYMRSKGQMEGHELKEANISKSLATPSLVGEKIDTRMKDFDEPP